MKALAGIVLYNPDIERLEENIKAVIDQVDMLLLVDNGSGNIADVDLLCAGFDRSKYEVIYNGGNLGIAKALNQIMEYAAAHAYEWALTLDQDSVCKEGLIEEYRKYMAMRGVGIFTCRIVDRNFHSLEKSADEECREVEKCITAGSFINTSIFEECGGFDEKMFIDGVDFDICYNIRRCGYKIVRIPFEGVLQEVGKGRNVKLLGKEYIIYNHSPFRCYYIARNNIYLAKKYKEVSMAHMIAKEAAAEVLTLLYEDNKFAKLKKRWQGLAAGICMKAE